MKRWIILILLIFVFLGAVIFFLSRGAFNQAQVRLALEAPESIIAGQELEYKVKIENKNREELEDVKLTLFHPDDSIVLNEAGSPLNSTVQNFNLGILNPGETREINFKAIITGERGEIKRVRALLTYSPSNVRSVFEKEGQAATTISRLSIPLTLVGPPNVLPGQNVQLILDFRNETENELGDLRVVFIYPDKFNFQRAVPSPSRASNSWSIPSLKANEGKRITVEGAIFGFEGEAKRFTAVLQKKIGNEFFDFQKIETQLAIATPLLTADILINEQENYIARTGERLEYKLKFSNNSSHNFSAVELRARLAGEMFDFSTLETNGFFDQNTKTILWNAAVEPLLSNLGPGKVGEAKFRIKLRENFPNTFGLKEFFVKVNSTVETLSVPPDFELDKISATDELLTRVSSKVSFVSRAFYNDSQISNSGPVPPRVGQKTTYTVHWELINQGDDLVNAEVSSFLLPGITFENKTKIVPQNSELSYNPRTGKVNWTISTVPSRSGIASPKFEAVFQVGLIPGTNQVNRAVELLKESEFKAVDNFTKEVITLEQTGITIQSIIDSPGAVQP